jgi:hypothetical protein
MQVRTSARRLVAPVAAFLVLLQLAACGGPYSLPASVRTPVGQSAHLVCAASEFQMCRDGGTAMRCSCSEY